MDKVLNQDAQSCRKSVDDFSRDVFNRHRCRSGNSSFGIIAQARPETFNRPDALRGRDWGLHACGGERNIGMRPCPCCVKQRAPAPSTASRNLSPPSVAGAEKLGPPRRPQVFVTRQRSAPVRLAQAAASPSAAYGRPARGPKKIYRCKAHRSQESPAMFWAAQAGGGLAFAGAAPKNKTARLQAGD